MEWAEYSREIQEWAEKIEEFKVEQPRKALKYAEKMKKAGERTGDDFLLGHAYNAISDYYYRANDVEPFLKSLILAIEYLKKSNQWEKAARAYDLMGMKYAMLGNAPLGQECQLKGIALCEEHNLVQTRIGLEYNIAVMYMIHAEYPTAIYHFKNAWSSLRERKAAGEEYNRVLLDIANISLAFCYEKVQDLEQAKEHLLQARKRFFGGMKKQEKVYFLMVSTRYYHTISDMEKRDICIEEIRKRITVEIPLIQAFSDFYDYCLLLLEIEKYEELWQVLDILDERLAVSQSAYMQKKLSHVKLQYYKKTGDEVQFTEEAKRYYAYSLRREKEESEVIASLLNAGYYLGESKKKQEQMVEENRRLYQQSMTDALTGIANRACFNRKAEKLLKKALDGGYYLAAEMLDVDYFKEFNDNYGHQKGDGCLKAVADSMKQLAAAHGNIFCARYGGDEFVLIYEGYTPEEVKKMAEELRSTMCSKAIEHKYSKVTDIATISQGVYCDIPKAGETARDFFKRADNMLYEVKRTSRNAIAVGSGEKGKKG